MHFSWEKKKWIKCPPAVDLNSHFYLQTTPHFPPRKKKAQSSSGHVLHLKGWKRWASSDSVQIGTLSVNKDLHLLLLPNKGVWFATNSVGHQRVKYNTKNYLKSLIWALTLLGYCSHKTATGNQASEFFAWRINVWLRQREFPRFLLKQAIFYVECENETNQLWHTIYVWGETFYSKERHIRKMLQFQLNEFFSVFLNPFFSIKIFLQVALGI